MIENHRELLLQQFPLKENLNKLIYEPRNFSQDSHNRSCKDASS